MSKELIVPIIIAALLAGGALVLSFIGTPRLMRVRQLIKDAIESIGAFCLFLIRFIPKSMIVRIPAWLGIPIVINGLLFFICLVADIAKPFFREVFGSDQDKPKK